MGRTPGPRFGLPHHRVAGRHQRHRGGRCVSWAGVSRLLASARGLVLCGLALAGAGLVLALAAPLVFAGLGAGFLLNPPPWMSPGLRAAPFAGLAVSLFLFPSVLLAVRRLANQARRLAAAWCGVPVAEPYRERPGGQKPGWRARLGWLFTDPATWRDLAWITVSTVGLLSAGVVLAVLAGPWLLRGYGRAAGLLLAPTRQAEIERLAGARAQAVAAAEAERRRMERDLHDGLQPRLVALAVDLGLAEARFEKDPDGSRLLLLEAVEKHQPELAIIDVRMPPSYIDEGLRAAIEIRRRWPMVALVVLSQFVEERYASELLAENTGRIGYLLKDRISDVGEFIEALARVADGGTALDPQVVRQLLARSRRADPLQRLTSREAEVLALMAEGRSNTAIAQALVISARAVEKHVASIFIKLDLPVDTDHYHRRVMAVVRYLNS
jgi:DNA-binding NarL/FixJ family response regulator